MKRRIFLRVVGGGGLTSVAAPQYIFAAAESSADTSGVLVEASSFENGGGWKLDTQHYQQMGGCYVL